MKRIRLFLSSPGDVEAERAKVHDVAARVNRMLGDELDFAIEVVDWKTHVAGDMDCPQEVINRQIGDYDIFVGIMWKRFGTPTGFAESGTEEEFNIAYANWQRFSRPRILFYFKKEPYSPGRSDEASQWVKVLAFKEGFQHEHPGLVREYLSTEEFANLLLENLARVVRELLAPPGEPGSKNPDGGDALGRLGDPRLAGDPMVEIPGGRFWMGAQKSNRTERNYYDEEARANESPIRQVELRPFFFSKYPVTVGQYRRFIDDGGYEDERHWKAGGFGKFKEPEKWEDQLRYPSRPVVYVSWYEAAAYASWAGGRLPTEAEWERAAKGPGEGYRKYPWGSAKPTGEMVNFGESNIGQVTPVGIFPENCSPEGVIDMAGNVCDWCESWYDAEKKYRVVRGSAFLNDSGILRSACRYDGDPDVRDYRVCFRVVRVSS
jgi:formylglycine-generating enzyme required for sulfatase activity